ncbi:hypothetical protein [Gemmobacter serpentinus]|uniref:hypothetical protein n=1 Tax=Gemmobacter serpentinus TaxID=2652247 RepID=UPI00124E08E4|nr:hypothetical protein [Gemmobacter serpentinus]
MTQRFGIPCSGLARPLSIAACLLAGVVASMQPARASSGDAWEEFAEDVRQTCLSAAVGKIAVNTIHVDPFGSESYGFAVLIGFEAGTTTERVAVCAYDKASQRAEISGLFER